MTGIALVWFSAILFVHMGLGDTIGGILHIHPVLFRCVKCLSFWTTLCYSLLIVELPAEVSVAIAFALSYASLWVDLVLAKLATVYENLYENMAAKAEEDSELRRDASYSREDAEVCKEESTVGEEG